MRTLTEPESLRASKIIHAYGSSSLAYFALAKDKSYFFNEDSAVAYALRNGVALALGDPIGPPQDTYSTIKRFKDFSEQNSHIPAFHSVGDKFLSLYAEASFKTLKIGEEALIDIQAFDIKGRSKSDLRAAMNKAEREGWSFQFYDHLIDDPTLADEIKAISEEWLTGKWGGEFGFTMSGTPLTGSNETLVTVALDSEGHAMAFMTLATIYGAKGWVGDFLRRTKKAPERITDYLIVSTIFRLRDRGDRLLSLGLAPLVNERSEGGGLISPEEVLALVYSRFNTIYHFKSLRHFKKKYATRWENRFLVYPGLPSLPRVVFAFLSLHTPNLRAPVVGRLERARGLVHRIEGAPRFLGKLRV
jgi:phosphatidylglycerol lysyltransferase